MAEAGDRRFRRAGDSIPGGGDTKGGVGFDMFGVDLTHHGEDCTFETMVKRFGLGDDPGLCSIAEIVHDIDLRTTNSLGKRLLASTP